jgi:hypothetical protein
MEYKKREAIRQRDGLFLQYAAEDRIITIESLSHGPKDKGEDNEYKAT